MQIKKQQLEPDVEQWTGSKLGKGYVKAVYCHPTYLKLKIQITKIMASSPIISWQIDVETMESARLFRGAPKSLQMVTAALKLKDACSLEEKLLLCRQRSI